jgi:hypothetical protein
VPCASFFNIMKNNAEVRGKRKKRLEPKICAAQRHSPEPSRVHTRPCHSWERPRRLRFGPGPPAVPWCASAWRILFNALVMWPEPRSSAVLPRASLPRYFTFRRPMSASPRTTSAQRSSSPLRGASSRLLALTCVAPCVSGWCYR